MEPAGSAIMPLYHFFNQLKKHSFTLGVDDYVLLLKTLKLQYGLDEDGYNALLNGLHENNALTENSLYPKHELLQIVKLLWLKPSNNQRLFEDLFEESYKLDFGARRTPKPAPVRDDKKVAPPLPTDKKEQDKPYTDTPETLPHTDLLNKPNDFNTDTVRIKVDVGES